MPQFTNLTPNDTAPANRYAALTPSDTTVLTPPCRGLFIGVSGDVALVGQETDQSVVFKNVPAGSILPTKASKVMATSTTASDIVALY